MTERQTYQLKHPIEHNGEAISSVLTRRATVGDLEIMEQTKGGDMARTIVLLSNLLELPPDAVRKMDPTDIADMSELIFEDYKQGKAAGDS